MFSIITVNWNGEIFLESYFKSLLNQTYKDFKVYLVDNGSGYKAYLVKNSIIYHIHSGTGINKSPFKTYYLTRNQLLYLRNNLEASIYEKYKYLYFFNIYIRIIYNIVKFDFKNAIAMINGLKDYSLLIRR